MNNEINLPGLIRIPSEFQATDPKQRVFEQRPVERGKEICARLRAMRIALAEANGIEFNTQDCKNPHPCAGTCLVCDEEIQYINQELNKIPSEQRIYPEQFMSSGNGGFR